VLAVGLRQKALQQRFLIATTASRFFRQPLNIRDHLRYPRENIRVNSRPFAVQKLKWSLVIGSLGLGV
jgi:hypothetical protein